jgi:hypothetical protein
VWFPITLHFLSKKGMQVELEWGHKKLDEFARIIMNNKDKQTFQITF